MKKLILAVALGVTGLVSANVNSVSTSTESQINSDYQLFKVLCSGHDWVKVVTSCGRVFYLDNNMYDNGECYECMQEDARTFTDAQCGQGASFELPF